MIKRINSKSDVQRNIEQYIFERICEIFGNIELYSNPSLSLDNDGKSYICPDFYSESEKIIGEIHSHEGRLKSAQMDKIASDVLKMILYDKISGCVYTKYIVVCDKEEYKQLQGHSYLAEAIKRYEIKLLYIKLTEELNKMLKDAMNKQNLIDTE